MLPQRLYDVHTQNNVDVGRSIICRLLVKLRTYCAYYYVTVCCLVVLCILFTVIELVSQQKGEESIKRCEILMYLVGSRYSW